VASKIVHFRFWPLSDMPTPPTNVRYGEQNGLKSDMTECLLLTVSRLWSAQQPDADNDKDAGECHPNHGVASASCEITAENDTGQ
jgi:hypothetical protein